MKILQVFNRYLEKGGEEIWVEEFEKLAEQDHEVSTLYFESDTWREGSLFERFRQARLMWNNPSSRHTLSKTVSEGHTEALVFHNVLPVGSFGLYQEAAKLNLPVFQYTHNFRPFSPSGTLWVNGKVEADAMDGKMWKEVSAGAWGNSRLKTALAAFYFKKFIKSGLIDQVTHWLAISDFMRDQFIAAGLPEEKVTTLRHCRKVERDPGESSDHGYYLFLGRLVPEKGCLMLVETWKNLERKLGGNCPKLVIAGTGPCEEEMKNLVGGSDKVRMAGFVSGKEKEALLRECRALLAPSIWWEPLGLIAYDGYEYGKPVLAARSGGLAEVVSQAGGGFLHEPGNVNDLGQKIEDIEEMSDEQRREIGKSGFEWLSSEAGPERWREKLTEILTRC